MSDDTRLEGREPPESPATSAPLEPQTMAGDEPVIGGEGGLYSDAWRLLRRRPMFVISGALIVLLMIETRAP